MAITDVLFGAPANDNTPEYSCVVCQRIFRSRSKKAKCCTRKCASALSQMARSVNAAARKMRVCEQCGVAFREGVLSKKQIDAGLRQRFCSRKCSADSKRVYATEAAAVRAKRERKRERLGFPKAKAEIDCSICAKSFAPTSIRQRLCSKECREIDARRSARLKAVANDNTDRGQRACEECGVTFAPVYGSKLRTFCSKKCGKRHAHRSAKIKRKAVERGVNAESVDPIKVFVRYKWKCYICGANTPRHLRGSNDNRSPELDHIIPVSKGGAHTYANTALACRKCNAEKSDQIYLLL
jgi:endogenous inhibitor of DNA gyrase (YacG/DUF329 family)